MASGGGKTGVSPDERGVGRLVGMHLARVRDVTGRVTRAAVLYYLRARPFNPKQTPKNLPLLLKAVSVCYKEDWGK